MTRVTLERKKKKKTGYLGSFSIMKQWSLGKLVSSKTHGNTIDCCMRITLKEQSYCTVSQRQPTQQQVLEFSLVAQGKEEQVSLS